MPHPANQYFTGYSQPQFIICDELNLQYYNYVSIYSSIYNFITRNGLSNIITIIHLYVHIIYSGAFWVRETPTMATYCRLCICHPSFYILYIKSNLLLLIYLVSNNFLMPYEKKKINHKVTKI